MKYSNFILLGILVTFSSVVKAEKINLNQLVNESIVLELSGDDLRIDDLPLCGNNPRQSGSGSDAASARADAVCKFLGDQMSPARELKNSRAKYSSNKFGFKTECNMIDYNGKIVTHYSNQILTDVNCILDKSAR